MGNLSIKKTDERQDRWRRLMAATGEATIAKALDEAADHYLADLHSKRQAIDVLPDELVDELSTPQLPLEREVTNRVGIQTSDE